MVDVPVRKGGVKKKPISISEYNMFTKGVDRANQYLAHYSSLKKTVKWTKKVALWLTNCALFNSSIIYKKLNPTTNLRYKEFLLRVAKAWTETESDTDLVQPGPSTPTPRRPHVDPPPPGRGSEKHPSVKFEEWTMHK
jgi:hypothetical protein